MNRAFTVCPVCRAIAHPIIICAGVFRNGVQVEEWFTDSIADAHAKISPWLLKFFDTLNKPHGAVDILSQLP